MSGKSRNTSRRAAARSRVAARLFAQSASRVEAVTHSLAGGPSCLLRFDVFQNNLLALKIGQRFKYANGGKHHFSAFYSCTQTSTYLTYLKCQIFFRFARIRYYQPEFSPH